MSSGDPTGRVLGQDRLYLGESPTCCDGDFKAHDYGQVILPLVVLRRLECALAPTKDRVVANGEELRDSPGRDAVLKSVARHRFWNASARWT